VSAAAAFLAAGWSAAQDANGEGETWFLGDESSADEDAEKAGDGSGDQGGVPSAAELGLPPEAGLVEVLAELRRRCGPPSLAETMDAATANAGLDPGPEEDLVVQARWAAALPNVRVTLRRDWQHDEALDVEPDPAAGQYGIDTDDHLEVGFTAQWDLGAIVAPPSAAAARRLALEAEAARRALRVEVAQAYSERCLLRLQWHLAPADDTRRTELALAIAERDARLDALTGGFFRRASEGEPEGREGTWSSAGTSDTR
jgi:hypothetical protein